MDFRILGPLQVSSGDTLLDVPPAGKRSGVLVALLLHRNQTVSVERLVSWLWGEDSPRAAPATLHAHVWRLRETLKQVGERESEILVTRGTGYELRLPDESLDATRFERLVGMGRALLQADPVAGAATLREAISLWRGPALAGFAEHPFARAESVRLEELRLGALEDALEAEMTQGRHVSVVADLEDLVVQYPNRERLCGLLMLALYRCGRQVDALDVYTSLQESLREELAIVPGRALRELHGSILRHDPALEWKAAASGLQPYSLASAPPTRYVRSRGLSIAYQVMGQGADLVCVPGGISHLDLDLELATPRRFYARLAQRFRLIRFDKPNTGLSDRHAGAGSLQDRIDDLWALLEAVGAEHPALMGVSAGGAIATLFAATYPERVTGLVLCGAVPYWGGERQFADLVRLADDHWGEGGFIEYLAPSLADVPAARESVARYERSAASPAAARAIFEEAASFDMRPLLQGLRVPTMVVHATGDRLADVRHGRSLAHQIPQARYLEVDSDCHYPWQQDPEGIADEICTFLQSVSAVEVDGPVLAILAVKLLHHDPGRFSREVNRLRGRLLPSHEGILMASFDSPRRAIRCALSVCGVAIGLSEARAAVDIGEVTVDTMRASGRPIDTTTDLVRNAGPGEVLVTTLVRDLMQGSGVDISPWGEGRAPHAFKVAAISSP